MGWKRVALCVCALALGVRFARAQEMLPDTPEAALHAMERRAGIIFTGQVTSVRLVAGAGGATGVVEIEFSVQDAVRGDAVRGANNGTYTLREWAGLWPGNDTPFLVGQRYLMLLHAPAGSGLASPVGGQDGAIPVRGTGANALVDLRWVNTRVARAITYAPEPPRARPIARPLVEIGQVRMASAGAAAPLALQPHALAAPASNTGQADQNKPYQTVLSMLRGWEKEDNGTR